MKHVVLLHLVADGLEVRAAGQLVESDLVRDAPVTDGDPVVGVPQHRFADRVVEGQNALFALDHRRVGAPGDPVDGVVDHHVRRDDPVEFACALQVHVPPPVEQDRPLQGLVVRSSSSAVGCMHS